MQSRVKLAQISAAQKPLHRERNDGLGTMGLTRDIGKFVAGLRYEHIPAEAVPTVCRGFTDCVGVLIAGLPEPVTSIVAESVGYAEPIRSIADFAPSRISALDLALIYGVAAHALDYDDTGLTGHPSAALVPAILAEAQDVGADGKAMIAAYIAGYEIWAEFAAREEDSLHQKGWHPSAVNGAIAAAGASAVLRKLDAETATRAMGIAASMASGLVSNFGSMTKPFHLGHSAQCALKATRLAQAGMTASPDAIEHELGFLRAVSPHGNVDTKSTARFGELWRILKLGINVKLYPMCFGTHRILDAMIDVCRDNGVKAKDIVRVDVDVSENSAKILRNSRPQTALEAKFSAEFAIAAAAIAGRCSDEEVATPFVQRPDVQEFFGKVRIHPVTEKDPEEPIRSPFDQVHLTLVNGSTLDSSKVKYPRGHFARGVERDVLWRKFSDCAGIVIDRERALRLFDALQDLPRLASINSLRQSLAPAAE
jgi:2-methylcitrate dehydratase PrpD